MSKQDTISPERAPGLGVALSFFVTGILFLAAMLAVAIWKAPLLTMDYLHNPAALAVTHLFTLGFAGSVIAGVMYQLTPVLLYGRAANPRIAALNLALHAPGVTLMAAGFLRFETRWVIAGGTMVTLAAALLLGSLAAVLRAAERNNWHGRILAAAAGAYGVTLLWGLTLALNQRFGFLGEVAGAPLASHAILGLLGSFSLLIAGVGLKLVPMFAPAKSLPPRFVAAVGLSLTAGVLLAVAGLLAGGGSAGASATVAGFAVQALGAALSAGALLALAGGVLFAWRRRRPGPLDFSVRFALAAACAGGTTVLPGLPWLAGVSALGGHPVQAGLVLFFALGWVGGFILGMLLRILPFMVWLHRFRNRSSKLERVPFLHEMYHPALGWAALGPWYAGTAFMAAGLTFSRSGALAAGAVLCVLGLAAVAAAAGQVLTHARPGAAPLYPGRRG